jgi:hypothetical protein
MADSGDRVVEGPAQIDYESLVMRGKLATDEIEKLLAALKRDKIGIGWLRPWLWREGWHMPPPLFMAVSTDGAAKSAMLVLAFGALGFVRFLALACFLLACWWVISDLCMLSKYRRGKWRSILMRIAVLAIGMVLSIWSLSRLSLGPVDYLTELRSNSLLCLFYFGLTMFRHWNSHAERKLPRWRDYVAMTLTTDAIA